MAAFNSMFTGSKHAQLERCGTHRDVETEHVPQQAVGARAGAGLVVGEQAQRGRGGGGAQQQAQAARGGARHELGGAGGVARARRAPRCRACCSLV